MRVVGYVRVSTDEQAANGAGLEAQRSAISAECDRRGWQLVELIEDAGFSAKNLKRPGVQRALQALRKKEAEGLVVAKLDRLSRSMIDFTGVMGTAQKEGWALVALDCAVDTTTPAGEAMANVLATFAQFERRLISQRTREALAVKKAQGVRIGRPAVVAAAVISLIQQQRGDGQSYAGIASGLNENGVPTAQGGRRWYAATVRDVLRRNRATVTRLPTAGPHEHGR
jgi:DNA invertase Pin-like site-specific DNA recombinase